VSATLATLRPAPAPHPTEERQRLAAAIDRLAAAQARVDRIAAAQTKAAALAHDKFREIEAAEAALAEARLTEPHRLVSRLLGDDPDPGPAAADVARTLNDAQAARNALATARDTLTAERQEADFSLGFARQNRDEAAAAVLRASPGVAALLDDLKATRARFASLRLALTWLAQQRILDDRQALAFGDTWVEGWQPGLPVLPVWQAAVLALQSDAYATLPGDGNNPKDAA
jgi:hypothetical protein